MREDYKDYYLYLEDLRQSGVTNMFGAAPFLAVEFDLDRKTAREILTNWMNNYSEIAEKYYKK